MMRCSLAKLWLSIGLAGLILTGCNTAMATSDTFEFRLEFETKDGPVKIIRPIHCETVWRGTGGKGYRMTPKFVRHRHKNGFFEVRLSPLCAQFDNPDSKDSFLGETDRKNANLPSKRPTALSFFWSIAWFPDLTSLGDAEIHDFGGNFIVDDRNFIQIASIEAGFYRSVRGSAISNSSAETVELPVSPIKQLGLPEAFVDKFPDYFLRRRKLAVLRVPEPPADLLKELDCSNSNICILPPPPQPPIRDVNNVKSFRKLRKEWQGRLANYLEHWGPLILKFIGDDIIEELLHGPNASNPYYQDLASGFGLRSSVQGPWQGVNAMALESQNIQLFPLRRTSLFEEEIVSDAVSSSEAQSLYSPGFLADFSSRWMQFRDSSYPLHPILSKSFVNIEGHKIGNTQGAIATSFVYVPSKQIVVRKLGGSLRYEFPMKESF